MHWAFRPPKGPNRCVFPFWPPSATRGHALNGPVNRPIVTTTIALWSFIPVSAPRAPGKRTPFWAHADKFMLLHTFCPRERDLPEFTVVTSSLWAVGMGVCFCTCVILYSCPLPECRSRKKCSEAALGGQARPGDPNCCSLWEQGACLRPWARPRSGRGGDRLPSANQTTTPERFGPPAHKIVATSCEASTPAQASPGRQNGVFQVCGPNAAPIS